MSQIRVRTRFLVIALSLSVTVLACGDGGGGGSTEPAEATILVVLPASLSLMATLTDRISVLAEDARGNAMPDADVTWESDDLAVATVDPTTGEITGVTVGSAMITASSGTASSDVALAVIPFATATFSGSVEPLLATTCTTSGCHTGKTPTGNLDLGAGNAFATTVGVASTDLPTMNLVQPNEPLQNLD